MVFDVIIHVTNFHYEIDKKAVYQRLGYKKGKTKISHRHTKLCDEILSEARILAEPKGVYLIRKIKQKNEKIFLLNSGTSLKGQSIKELLKDSVAVIFMAVTIGFKLEEKIQREMESSNHERALVYDVAGSETVEGIAQSLYQYLEIQARQSKKELTRRFSPGYGDFSLTFQSDLSKELSLSGIGIKLDQNHLLSPQKSITAVIGVEA